MKRKIVASLMALCTAFSFVSCKTKVADKNKNIASDKGGGYFYITNDGNDYYIHVRNNSWVGNVDVTCRPAHGVEYEFEYDGVEYVLGKTDNGWELA